MLEIGLMIAGFVMLPFGAHLLVDGSMAVARRFGLGAGLATLLIVAFGTSLPELAVNLVASTERQDLIVIGNVYGSSIANVLLILGLASLIHPMRIAQESMGELRAEMGGAFWITALTIALGIILPVFLGWNVGFSRWHGIFILAAFLGFMALRIRAGVKQGDVPQPSGRSHAAYLTVPAGLLLLGLGGHLIVDGVTTIRYMFGIGEGFIAATVVAIGTSLPEMATVIALVRRDRGALAITDVVGSNVFNVGFILALSIIIAPLGLESGGIRAIFLACLSVSILAIVLNARKTVSRLMGAAFMATYFIMAAGLN